jgi:hypothetical protein
MKAFYGDDIITPVQQQRLSKSSAAEPEGKVIKNKYASALLFGTVILLITGFEGYNAMQEGNTSAAITWFVAGGLLLLVVIFIFIQTSLKERTAAIMHARSIAANEPKVTVVTIKPSIKAFNIPPFKLEVYEQNELPDIAFTYNKKLSEEGNIFNIAPLKIFYFFNFYSPGSWEKKMAGGWQRHGPVFHLGSPDDIAINKTLKFYTLEKTVNRLLITSPEKLIEAIDNSTYKPLLPRTKGLLGENFISGAYPVNSFLCTDTIWQQCVELLFKKTDFSIIDAGDYTADRAGLQWEITQVINHLSTEKFVVLINGKTDIVSLGETFRKAWKEMDEASPNNTKDVTSIRFIFYQVPDREIAKREHKNFLLEILRQQTLSNDRIISFALRSKRIKQ